MSGEIRLQATAELTVKALIVGEDGTVWSGSAMVAVSTLSDANWTSSLIACTEQDTSGSTGTGLYVADWPGALSQAALYSVVFFSGAAPSPGDLHIGSQEDPTSIISAIQTTGSGALSTTIYCQTDGEVAIDGVEVWITSDSAGSNVVAGTVSSDATGLVTFMLDAGTYFVWKQLSGMNFTNPTEIVVS